MRYFFVTLCILSAFFCFAEDEDYDEIYFDNPYFDEKTDNSDKKNNDVPYNELEKILASPDFGTKKDSLRIEPKKFEPKEIDIDIDIDAKPWIKIWNIFTSYILRLFLILSIIAAIIFFIIFYNKYKKKTNIAPPVVINEDAAILLKKAILAYSEARIQDAWTYCFKCAISALMHCGIKIPLNATEYECLSIVKNNSKAISSDFEKLIKNRIDSAYRSITPSSACFDEAVVFCKDLIKGHRIEK
jgi:hypothetical protein